MAGTTTLVGIDLALDRLDRAHDKCGKVPKIKFFGHFSEIFYDFWSKKGLADVTRDK